MKKILLGILMMLSMQACQAGQNKSANAQAERAEIEVMYFHGKQRCVTCRTIEQVVEEVMQTELQEAVASGKLHYRAIDLTEETKLADQYEVSWSSLIIDKNGTVYNLTDEAFSYARSNPDKLKEIIRQTIGL